MSWVIFACRIFLDCVITVSSLLLLGFGSLVAIGGMGAILFPSLSWLFYGLSSVGGYVLMIVYKPAIDEHASRALDKLFGPHEEE